MIRVALPTLLLAGCHAAPAPVPSPAIALAVVVLVALAARSC